MEVLANGIYRLTFGEPEENTAMTFKHFAPREDALRALPEAEPPAWLSAISASLSARGMTLTLPAKEGEQFFGLGLQLKSFNQKGLKKKLRVNSDPAADLGDSHAPVPFFVSTEGYGVLVDTLRNPTFHFGTHQKKALRALEESGAEKDAPKVSTDALYGERADGSNTVIEIPHVKGVTLYVFGGPTLSHAVARYNLFSGGGCLPPMWGLGIWYRACSRATEEEVLALAANLRNSPIPCDVFGFEPGWQTHAYSCSYVWDKERFPTHEMMLALLEAKHFHVNLWEHAFVHPTSPLYEPLYDHSGSHEVWGGLVPDFGSEEAHEAFRDYHLESLIQKGISGFKLDECDHSDYIKYPWSFPEYSSFPSGLDGEQMHNLFGKEYQHALLEAFRKDGKRTYSEVRSSHAFAAPYPFVLYSDLYEHKDFIRGMVNAGFSGLLWCPEVRQCEDEEDLLRRLQSVIFSPQALVNAWMIPHPPWLQYDEAKNAAGDFLKDYKRLEKDCADIFKLRMRLIPYLYAAFAKYAAGGIPPFRALVLDYPDDPNTYGIDDAWLVGESLLFAPVVRGEKKRRVYLPEGEWVHFFTRRRYPGGQSYDIDVPLHEMALFVKNDTLLPLADPVQYVDESTVFDITAEVYGNPQAPCILLDDDGAYGYEEGEYKTMTLAWDGKHMALKQTATARYRFVGERIIESFRLYPIKD